MASGGQERQLCIIDIPEPLLPILGLTLHWSRCRAMCLPMMEFPWPFYGVRVGSRVSVEHQTEPRECLSSGRCCGDAGRVDTTWEALPQVPAPIAGVRHPFHPQGPPTATAVTQAFIEGE